MFYIRWAIILGVTMSLAAFSFTQVRQFVTWLSSAKPLLEKQSSETRSNVHWLTQDKPLIYTFTASQTDSIRVLSNAIFSQPDYQQPADYAIEYTMLDADQRAITQAVYHHTSKLALDEQQQQVKQIIENRQSLAVSTGQSFYLNHSQFENATAIAFRLILENPLLKGVVLRVHSKEKSSPTDIYSAWLRYPLPWRARISNYHTLGGNALSEQEIFNAVKYDWRKLAPQGVPNVDFTTDTLYETLPYHIQSYDFSTSQLSLDGFFTDHSLSASVNVTQPQDIYFSTTAPEALTFRWYDYNQWSPPQELTAIKTNTDTLYKLSNVSRGMITIKSDTAVLSQWFLANKQPIDPLHSLYYQVNKQDAIKYSVTSDSQIKLDIRPAKSTHLTVNIYDEQDSLIKTYNTHLEAHKSEFDRALNDDTERTPISESSLLYLHQLPSNSAYIMVQSDGLMAFKLHTRKASYHTHSTLCDTSCDKQNSALFDIPPWYPQKADNDYQLMSQNKTITVRLFSAPPAQDVKKTAYVSRDLSNDLAIANTALINSPKPYYLPKDAFETYHYAEVDMQFAQQLLNRAPPTPINLIVKSNHPPLVREFDTRQLASSSNGMLFSNNQRLFANVGTSRPWTKQRLYKLDANRALKLNYQKTPYSVVVKAYSTSSFTTALELSTQIDAQFKTQINQTYSFENKRTQLYPSSTTRAFMLHPSLGELVAYPSMTVLIDSDISELNSLILKSNKDIWLSVIEEFEEHSPTFNWWLNEDN
ncbi:hypothetical protein HG263_18145 [Pseudoalteromonas sp. JBTF-M23]|uniref:Uncharacterized protein n=1 Tax=Pseudoalteromonas caenipelagi TaxID=2726988 RepID=A0A849VIE4_9GAMM|nr:hypothetical protein [Pseudoalteromonas caenipelagi]NOU52448.1 hypothetical protein [Pseudoalteromonas caenipelagi]